MSSMTKSGNRPQVLRFFLIALLLIFPLLRRTSLMSSLAAWMILLIIVLALLFWKQSVFLHNLKAFARFLHADVRRPFLGLPFSFIADGRWRDRNVRVKFSLRILRPLGLLYEGISIEPKVALGVGESLPYPTKLTAFYRERIYYQPTNPCRNTQFSDQAFSDEEVRSILDELTRAAENVETGRGLEFACPSCATMIRKEEKKCSTCGWTWT